MTGESRPGMLAKLLAGAVRGYQLIVSPWFAPTCRYYPSCSSYAIEALRVHGAIRGTGLAVWRLLRCNPWSLGGVDHVPPRRETDRHDHQDHHHATETAMKGRTLSGRTSRRARA